MLKHKDLQELRLLAVRYAVSRGLTQYAEDFASYVMLRSLEGKLVYFKWSFIDFKREQFGDSRQANGKLEMSCNLSASTIESYINRLSVTDPYDVWTDCLRTLKISDKEKTIFLLYYKIGYTVQEIGDRYNLTGPAISMRLTKTIAKIKAHVEDTY